MVRCTTSIQSHNVGATKYRPSCPRVGGKHSTRSRGGFTTTTRPPASPHSSFRLRRTSEVHRLRISLSTELLLLDYRVYRTGEDDEDGDDDEPPPAPEGIFSRTMTLLRGKKDKDDISRTSTTTRRSFRPGNARRSAAVGRHSVSERFLHNLAQAPRLRRKRRLLRALALRRRSSSHGTFFRR